MCMWCVAHRVQEPELSSLQLLGIDVQLHDAPHTLLEGFFYVSGHIPRATPYETGNPNHASQWVSDQLRTLWGSSRLATCRGLNNLSPGLSGLRNPPWGPAAVQGSVTVTGTVAW